MKNFNLVIYVHTHTSQPCEGDISHVFGGRLWTGARLIIVSNEYIITYLQLTYYQGYQTICMPSFWGET